MIGPAFQKAIFDRLKAANVAGGRIYDRVPAKVEFPYVTISDEQIVDFGDGCAEDMVEVFVDIHVWSRAVGRVEAKTVGAAIRFSLKNSLSVEGFAVILHEFQTARSFLDADGLTSHAVLTYRFVLQPVGGVWG